MTKTNQIITDLRRALADFADRETRAAYKTFFEEEVKAYGVKYDEVIMLGKLTFERVRDFPKQDILEMCEELWLSEYNEEAYIACNWSEYLHEQYEPADFGIFEFWIKEYVCNWATCDTLCNNTIGRFIIKYPEFIADVKKWTKSSNRWVKRGAASSMIIPAREGLFIGDILEIADMLLLNRDKMVRQGYGWMLKAASETSQQAVFDFVMARKKAMPRSTLRCAVDKMPNEMRMEAIRK